MAAPQIQCEETDPPVTDLRNHLTRHMLKLYHPELEQPVHTPKGTDELGNYCSSNKPMKWQVTRLALGKAITLIRVHDTHDINQQSTVLDSLLLRKHED